MEKILKVLFQNAVSIEIIEEFPTLPPAAEYLEALLPQPA